MEELKNFEVDYKVKVFVFGDVMVVMWDSVK